MTGRAMRSLTSQLKRLEQTIATTAQKGTAPEHFAAWREVLRLYEDVSRGRTDPEPAKDEVEYTTLWKLAGQAMVNLGGQADPSLTTLAQYDHTRYGPMLGVSNEGSATAAVRRGALASPKCAVLREHVPLTVGVAHDAERLGAVGEVAVGPDEYTDIRLACMGRLLTTTNVGTRANIRHYLLPPVVRIKPDGTPQAVAAAVEELKRHFKPFWKTPSGRPRALTVLVQFDEGTPPGRRGGLFGELQSAVARGEFCAPGLQRLGLLSVLREGAARLEQAKAAIDLARQCRLTEVTLDGPVLGAAHEAISLPGLLDHFEPGELAELLRYAKDHTVQVIPKLWVDPATTARHIWTGLAVARNMGFELGKYGLVPLTYEEQKLVIVRVQHWFKHWCPAPAFYLDYPLVTAREVYHGPRLARGIECWLKMLKDHKVRVVLIDTAKKSEGRYVLKNGPRDDRGFLSLDEIRKLDATAVKLGIKVLWAGGITVPQVFEFGKLGVFGIYVTSAAAELVPVGRKSRRDPYLVGVRKPKPEAVAQVKLLLEAGFLVNRLQGGGSKNQADELEAAARRLIEVHSGPDEREKKQREAALHRLAVEAWKVHFSRPARD